MKDDLPSLELRLMTLLHHAREDHDEEARRELNAILREDAEARRLMQRLLVDEHAIISELTGQSIVALIHPRDRDGTSASALKQANGWFSWRLRSVAAAAAAAGIAIGLFCNSIVFAYVAPYWGTQATVLADGFESGPAPLAKGVPLEAGVWSGDYAEVVGDQQGVRPADGAKMLRFLRSDYEDKANPERGHVADIYRLIDMRPYRHEAADGGLVVQCLADLNTAKLPKAETYSFKLSIQAFDAETVTSGELRVPRSRFESDLATASSGKQKLDKDPESWQRLAVDMRLPPNAEFLLICIAVEARGESLPKARFEGHYLDNVRLTMRRSPLP